MNNFLYFLQLLKEIVIPRRCEVCGEIIQEGAFCPVCRMNFVLSAHQDCNNEVRRVYFLFHYKEQLRDLIRAAKFNQCTQYLYPLREEADLLLQGLTDFDIAEYDCVAIIPASADRRKERGFDLPAELFGFLPADKIIHVLDRVRQTTGLFALSPGERRRELTGCFALNHDVRGKRILLLDDIYTTGATAQEAAGTLLQGGAVAVDMLAFSTGRDDLMSGESHFSGENITLERSDSIGCER